MVNDGLFTRKMASVILSIVHSRFQVPTGDRRRTNTLPCHLHLPVCSFAIFVPIVVAQRRFDFPIYFQRISSRMRYSAMVVTLTFTLTGNRSEFARMFNKH